MAVDSKTFKYWDVRMQPSSAQGPLETSGITAVRGAIMNLFATPYGSRGGIFMPNYGNRIHLYLHENIDEYTASAFKMAMMEDLRSGFPIISVDFSKTVVKPILQGRSPGFYVWLSINANRLVQQAFSLEFNALAQ